MNVVVCFILFQHNYLSNFLEVSLFGYWKSQNKQTNPLKKKVHQHQKKNPQENCTTLSIQIISVWKLK